MSTRSKGFWRGSGLSTLAGDSQWSRSNIQYLGDTDIDTNEEHDKQEQGEEGADEEEGLSYEGGLVVTIGHLRARKTNISDQ
jgi:hypothetical protein